MTRLSLLAATALGMLAAAPAPALAQQGPLPSLTAGHTLLTINAKGSSTREPDLASYNAGVTTQGSTASAALTANSEQMTKVMAALKRAGIADKDVQTSNLNVSPIYAQPKRLPDGSYEDNGQQRIVGYQANNSVTVRQRKLGDMGKVIDALVTAGANQVNGPDFMLSEPEAAMDEARMEAMKVARSRAELYARAAGLRVARIVSVSENGGYAPQPVMYVRKEARDSMASAPAPVAAGELEMTVNVNVQFELAP